MLLYIKILAVSLFAVVLQHVLRFGYKLGLHVTVYNHTPGPCRLVPNVENGAEDIQVLSNGIALISAGYSASVIDVGKQKRFSHIKGRILTFDFNNPENPLVELKIKGIDLESFSPHGISLWENKNTGEVTVFIVNHCRKGDQVEKFKYSGGSELQHIESVRDKSFVNLNDVLAVSENTFYVTNYGGTSTPMSRKLEAWLMLPWGHVTYYDGTTGRTVADGLWLTNGVNLSPDGKYLYVAYGDQLNTYQRRRDNTLDFIETTTFPCSFLDNIHVDDRGDLWLAHHPRVIETMEHLENGKSPAASRVFKVETHNGRLGAVTSVYANDGSDLWGSTIAVNYNKQMLIGTVMHKLMYCEIRAF